MNEDLGLEPADQPEPSRGPGPRKKRRAVRIAVALIVAAVVVPMLLVGGLILGLSTGLVDSGFIARRAEAALAEVLGPDTTVAVEHAEIGWSWDGGLALRLSGVALDDRRGAFGAAVREMDAAFAPTRVVLGRFVPHTVSLLGADIAVATSSLFTGGETNLDEPEVVLGLAARRLKALFDEAAGAGIERLRLVDGRMILRQRTREGQESARTFSDLTIDGVFASLPARSEVTLSARGAVSRWSATLAREAAGDGGDLVLLRGADLDLRDLAITPRPDSDVTFPIYPDLTLRLDPAGTLTAAEARLQIGAGIVRFGADAEDTILLDEGDAELAWDPQAAGFIIRRVNLESGETRIVLSGSAVPPPRGVPGPWRIDLALAEGQIRPKDVPEPPLALDTFTIAATVDARNGDVDLHRVEIAADGTTVTGKAAIRRAPGATRADLTLQATPMTARTAKRLWPHFVAPGARTWLIEHVEEGRFEDFRATLKLPRLADPPPLWPKDAAAASLRATDATVRVLGALPSVADVQARIAFADRRLTVSVDRAPIATKVGRRPILSNLAFTIPDALKQVPRGEAQFQVSGDVAALAEIIAAEPIDGLDGTGLQPEALQGGATVQVSVALPLEVEPKAADVVYRLDAQIDGFASREPIAGRKITDGKLKLVADPAVVTVTGRAQIDGIAADVNVVEGRDKRHTDRRDMKMTLDEASRTKLGIDLTGFVSGPIGLAVEQNPTEPARRKITADLGPARLALAPLGWTKGPGVAGKAVFDFVEAEKGTRIENLAIDSEGMQIRGSIQLDATTRKPSLIDLGRFALRKGDDAKLQVRRTDQGGLVIALDAKSFDVRGLLDRNRGTGGGDAPDPRARGVPDTVVKLKAARLVGFNDLVLSDATLDAAMQAGTGTVTRLQFTAKTPGGGTVQASITTEGGVRRLRVTSDDAGALAAFIDVYPRMRRGRLRLEAVLTGPNTADGKVAVNGFELVGEPAVKRGADPTQPGAIKIKEASPRDAEFDRMSLSFAYRAGAITLSDAVARGPTAGAVASGRIDTNNGRIEVSGTYIPAFPLNNLVSRIPLVGIIAGAGRDEGLLGVTFKLTGKLEEPYLMINPMSAIAPGIFRKVFEFN